MIYAMVKSAATGGVRAQQQKRTTPITSLNAVEQLVAGRTRLRRIMLTSLKQKATEQQDAEDNYNRNNDQFDQGH